jgi:hypothetical protein
MLRDGHGDAKADFRLSKPSRLIPPNSTRGRATAQCKLSMSIGSDDDVRDHDIPAIGSA